MENYKNYNEKLFVVKKILKYAFVVSGFLPANYLLFWAIYLLFGPLFFGDSQNIKFEQETILFYGSIIIGTFGYFGLLLSIIQIRGKNFFLGIKILFLTLGIMGFCIFSSQGDNGFDGFLESFSIDIFSVDWFLWCWPNIVALVLIFYYLIKFIKNIRHSTSL